MAALSSSCLLRNDRLLPANRARSDIRGHAHDRGAPVLIAGHDLLDLAPRIGDRADGRTFALDGLASWAVSVDAPPSPDRNPPCVVVPERMISILLPMRAICSCTDTLALATCSPWQ